MSKLAPHFRKNLSSKSNEPNWIYHKNSIFWDQIWSNLGLNDGHARARTGKHVTKLSVNSSYQEHFLKLSLKSDEPNSRYLKNDIFGPNMA